MRKSLPTIFGSIEPSFRFLFSIGYPSIKLSASTSGSASIPVAGLKPQKTVVYSKIS
jgi:hypothetical protein